VSTEVSRVVGLIGLLGEREKRPDRRVPSLRRIFVAWEADALPVELLPFWVLRDRTIPDGPLSAPEEVVQTGLQGNLGLARSVLDMLLRLWHAYGLG
jgi:hypothetical protein